MKIKYHFSCSNPVSQFIQIEVKLSDVDLNTIELQLPTWRAGRYQLADYAQNVRFFSITDQFEKPVRFEKKGKSSWTFNSRLGEDYYIRYEYFAAKMDAGSCWVDPNQFYINFVNCCMEVMGTRDLGYEVTFQLPTTFSIATTLPLSETAENSYYASSFQELADSTFLAAENLTHWEYQVGITRFHCWFNGEIHFSKSEFLARFEQFTGKIISDFGEFPEPHYHFIFQLLPYQHYHGVEHQKGTVITFGPAKNLADPIEMEELLGVSCHELYHAWNVCRIRPTELLPYDFSKETFTKSGWILEGVTTYMGDLYLLKSGVYSFETYLKHLTKIINRDAQNLGWQNYSILESSWDLWLDGYQAGIPDRKVNIYTHGALICLCLDIMLLEGRGKSLTDVMKAVWEKFGKTNKGYSQMIFWKQVLSNSLNDQKMNLFYSDFISGKKDLIEKVRELIPLIGLELTSAPSLDPLTSKVGILLANGVASKIHSFSPAYSEVMIGDEIKYVSTEKSITVYGKRINGLSYVKEYVLGDQNFFPTYSLKITNNNPLQKKWMK